MSDYKEKLFVNPEPKEVEIEFEDEIFTFKVREVSWATKNKILGNCVKMNPGSPPSFELDRFMREMLCATIVEAPWGETTNLVLSQLKTGFGTKLEILIPREGIEEGMSDFFGKG